MNPKHDLIIKTWQYLRDHPHEAPRTRFTVETAIDEAKRGGLWSQQPGSSKKEAVGRQSCDSSAR